MRFISALCLLVSATILGKTAKFDLRDLGGRNLVYFISDATIEKIVGTSSSISGWVELDPEKVSDGIRGELEIDFRNFHTGMESRNQLIREKVFGTSEFPDAKFSLGKVVSAGKGRLIASTPLETKIEFQLTWRRSHRSFTVPTRIQYFPQSELTRARLPGNLLRLNATFEIDLSNFEVRIPDQLSGRFSKNITMVIDVVGTDQPPGLSPIPEPPRPKEGARNLGPEEVEHSRSR